MPKVSAAHREARRNQILDAATSCFARYGIRETTIQKICEEAGLSAGAVYRYFDGKQAILTAVYARSTVQNSAFGEAVAGSDDPVETLRGLVRGMVALVDDPDLREQHQLSIRVHGEALFSRELAADYVAVHHAVVAQFTPLLTALQQQGRIADDVDAEYFVWLLITLYQGLRVQRLLDDSLDMERFADAFVQAVDRALGL